MAFIYYKKIIVSTLNKMLKPEDIDRLQNTEREYQLYRNIFHKLIKSRYVEQANDPSKEEVTLPNRQASSYQPKQQLVFESCKTFPQLQQAKKKAIDKIRVTRGKKLTFKHYLATLTNPLKWDLTSMISWPILSGAGIIAAGLNSESHIAVYAAIILVGYCLSTRIRLHRELHENQASIFELRQANKAYQMFERKSLQAHNSQLKAIVEMQDFLENPSNLQRVPKDIRMKLSSGKWMDAPGVFCKSDQEKSINTGSDELGGEQSPLAAIFKDGRVPEEAKKRSQTKG